MSGDRTASRARIALTGGPLLKPPPAALTPLANPQPRPPAQRSQSRTPSRPVVVLRGNDYSLDRRDQAAMAWVPVDQPAVGGNRTYALAVVASPQTLSLDARRVLAAWAADCAEHVLSIYETAVPGDIRVRTAIDQARAFAAGVFDVAEAVRRRGGDAGAAARDAPTPAAQAAAYAAEQAAAVAHMGAHALGAAGYAAKASTHEAGRDDDEVAQSEAHRQVAKMTDAVATAILSLPALGENRSGPLGPGRLSVGHVGATIREIQRLLANRA